jgi:outer membrane protein assembly factor BamB
MKPILLATAFVALSLSVSSADDTPLGKGNWTSWRGPLQTGVSLESYEGYAFNPEPIWTDAIASQGAPVVHNGRIYSWGYRGKGPDLVEVVQAREEKTGKVIWERTTHDFMSDTVYDRYTIGSVTVDPETENVLAATAHGLVTCYSKAGDIVWEVSAMERFGRLTFPNARAGAPVIDGDLVIIHAVTSYWGADGPAKDRFLALDKKTGEHVWSSTPGVGPPFLKDSSFSTPLMATVQGKRVFYAGTGCGNVVCVNAKDGTPLWRFQATVGGVNASPVIIGDLIYSIHGTENLDSTEMGRAFALKLPADLNKVEGTVDPVEGGAPLLAPGIEAWRQPMEMFTSSPVLHDGKIYQMLKIGVLACLEATTGKVLWEEKLVNSQLHASPLYADGRLYVPTQPGDFYVINVTGDKPVIEHTIKLAGNAVGSPALCNGRVYVHTTEKLYAFEIKNTGILYGEAPAAPQPAPGEPAKLMTIPADVLLTAGDSTKIRVFLADANGNVIRPLAEDEATTWETFIPPTAKVKSMMDASFEGNTITTTAAAKDSAGAWKVTSGGFSGILRGRVAPKIPFTVDFEDAKIGEDGYAFPPLSWIGARLKFDIRELEGSKVLTKTLDRVIFQRSLTFIGSPDSSGYTVQADMMTDGTRRIKSTVGLINQRYIISLMGNAGELEISSNQERIAVTAPFPIAANKWYTLKTRVDVADDGSGIVRAKAWVKGEPEPEAWTLEFTHQDAHKEGCPGIFGFSPQSMKSVYVDNFSVVPNEK